MLLNKQVNELHRLVDNLFIDGSASDYIDLLLTYYTYWSSELLNTNEQGYQPTRFYQVRGEAIDRIHTLMRLMHFLAALSETWSQVERTEKSLNATQQP